MASAARLGPPREVQGASRVPPLRQAGEVDYFSLSTHPMISRRNLARYTGAHPPARVAAFIGAPAVVRHARGRLRRAQSGRRRGPL